MAQTAARARSEPTRQHVLSLYRRMLQQASLFKDYNFRETALRKTKEQFRANRSVHDIPQLSQLYQSGLSQLAVLQRQTTVHNLYHHQPYIIETEKQSEAGKQAGKAVSMGQGWRVKVAGEVASLGAIEGDQGKEKEQLTPFTYGAHNNN